MDRPRVAATISAAAASVAAFSVVSHWRLVGTLAGAALVPIIYTLVSHWSSAGLDRAGRWVRRRLGRGRPEKGAAASEEPTDTAPAADARVPVPRSGRSRRALGPQWLLVGSAVLALAVSVYTLATVPPGGAGEKVVVQRVVVEKTVTVTTVAQGSTLETVGASAPAGDAPSLTASPGDGSADQSAPDDGTASTVSEPGDPQEAPSESDVTPPAASVPEWDDGATVSTTATTVITAHPGEGEGASPPTSSTPPPTTPAQ